MKAGKQRIEEMDMLKCVAIMLMVAFHLVYVEAQHPVMKDVVYTFHMPLFLMISGYLCRTTKQPRQFLSSLLTLAVPYLIMESAYIVGAAMLPINEHIDHLTPLVFIDKLLAHPLGPYWYLHTLVICNAFNYLATHGRPGLSPVWWLLLMLALNAIGGFITWSSMLYYSLGVLIARYASDFRRMFLASPLSVVALIIIAADSLGRDASGQLIWTQDSTTLKGVIIVFCVTGSLLYAFRQTSGKLRSMMLLIGRETLAVLLFSPFFTLVSKYYQPFVCTLDPSGFLFAVVTVVVAIAGSILLKRCMEKFRIARFLFLRK